MVDFDTTIEQYDVKKEDYVDTMWHCDGFFYVTMHYCDSTISQYDVTKEHCDDKTVLYSDGITKLC